VYEAAVWYEARDPGLGARSLDAIEDTLHALASRPLAFPKVVATLGNREVRRALLRRFPFAVVYFVAAEEVRVVAAPHVRRSPGYWLYRIIPEGG
jgi:plasmid stabilization system protein ParE